MSITSFQNKNCKLQQSLQDHHIVLKWKLSKVSSSITTTPSQSENLQISLLSWPPYPLEMKIAQDESHQDHHTLSKKKLSKSVLSRPPHPCKVNTVKKSALNRTTTPSQSRIYRKSVLSRSLHLSKWKLWKINSFKTTTPSQNGNP